MCVVDGAGPALSCEREVDLAPDAAPRRARPCPARWCLAVTDLRLALLDEGLTRAMIAYQPAAGRPSEPPPPATEPPAPEAIARSGTSST